MSSVHDILEKFKNGHAVGALSGAEETLDYINEGKEHLVYPFYKQTCQYGDWEKTNGIEEIVDALNRRDLLKNPMPQIYFHANDALGEEMNLDDDDSFPKEEVELYFDLSQGRYKIIAELDKKGSDGEYAYEVETHSGGIIDRGVGYVSSEEAWFDVNELEEGIVKVTVTAMKWSKLTKLLVDKY